MVDLPVLIHSLQMCATGNSEMCSECHLKNRDDCSQELSKEAANVLQFYFDEEDGEPGDFDLEMGFDPYEGCYTFDC